MRIFTRTFFAFLLLLSLSFAMVSCNVLSAQQPAQATLVTGSSTAKPILTPDATKGTVKGVLKLKGQPQTNDLLGLGKIIMSTEGLEIATQFDFAHSPQTDTMPDGSFVFQNVPPGRYGLIYATGPNSYLLMDPAAKGVKAILLDVKAGETTDLGVMDFDTLPTE